MADKALCSLDEFLKDSFDFVIVGGGTAGCCLAARLTDNPDIRVGVIEAGKARFGDQNVEGLGGLAAMLHNPDYDWVFKSIPQVRPSSYTRFPPL
jgi:choline dehydrogenase-like flavoprotein